MSPGCQDTFCRRVSTVSEPILILATSDVPAHRLAPQVSRSLAGRTSPTPNFDGDLKIDLHLVQLNVAKLKIAYLSKTVHLRNKDKKLNS